MRLKKQLNAFKDIYLIPKNKNINPLFANKENDKMVERI